MTYRSSLWSSGQSSWLQIQRSGFWEVVGLERGPLSLVSTIEELLGRKNSGSGLESREYGRRDPLSAKVGTNSVGIVRSRTQAMEPPLTPNDIYTYNSILPSGAVVQIPFRCLIYPRGLCSDEAGFLLSQISSLPTTEYWLITRSTFKMFSDVM
jgi:hypothetical protein